MRFIALLMLPALLVSSVASAATTTTRIRAKRVDGNNFPSGSTLVVTSQKKVTYPNIGYGLERWWVTAFMGTEPLKIMQVEFPLNSMATGMKWGGAETTGNSVFGQVARMFDMDHSSSTVSTYFSSCATSFTGAVNDAMSITLNSGSTIQYRTYYAVCSGTSQCSVTESSSWSTGTSMSLYVAKNGGNQRIDYRLGAYHTTMGVVAFDNSASSAYITFNNSCSRTGYGSGTRNGIEPNDPAYEEAAEVQL